MDVKKISVIAVIAAILFIVGYLLYNKFFTKNTLIDGTDKTVDEEQGEDQTTDPLAFGLSNLSAADEEDAYKIAAQMYEDCKGWNSHDMSTYDYVNKWNDIKFYFFVKTAYPAFDKRYSLAERLKRQNWGSLNGWSLNHGYNSPQKARELISKIIYRIEHFKL